MRFLTDQDVYAVTVQFLALMRGIGLIQYRLPPAE
jgi:hypothetical protein